MSKEPTTTKIKLEAKPLNAKQRWNVFVVLLPWALLTLIGYGYACTQVGIMWEKNRTNDITAAKAEVAEQLKAQK